MARLKQNKMRKQQVRNKETNEGAKNHHPSIDEFQRIFFDNEFGYPCNVCDRLWFRNDLKQFTTQFYSFLQKEIVEEDVTKFRLCHNCFTCMKENRLPGNCKLHGFQYPERPRHLPTLNNVTERHDCLSYNLVVIVHIKYGTYKVIGQIDIDYGGRGR